MPSDEHADDKSDHARGQELGHHGHVSVIGVLEVGVEDEADDARQEEGGM